jgi:TolB-like protein
VFLTGGVASATKQLTVGGTNVTSKNGTTLPADLLDRELAIPAATTIGLANGVAGDTVAVTYLVLP